MNRRSLASGSNDTAARMAHLPRVKESASAEGRGSEVWLAAQASTLTRRLQMASAPLLEVCGVQPPEHQDMRPEHSSDVEIDSGDRPRVRSSTSAIVLDSGDRPRAVELPLCQHSQDVELPWSCLELPWRWRLRLQEHVVKHIAETMELEIQILQPRARYSNVTRRIRRECARDEHRGHV